MAQEQKRTGAGRAFQKVLEADPQAQAALRRAQAELKVLARVFEVTVNSTAKRRAEAEYCRALAAMVSDSIGDLPSLGFSVPKSIEGWEKLAYAAEIPIETVRKGDLTASEIHQCVQAWAMREEAKRKLDRGKQKRPSKAAFGAHELHRKGYSQTRIAEMLTAESGRKVHQGTVSKYIAKVKAYLGAGGVLPEPLDPPATNSDRPSTHPTDPQELDHQGKRDGRFRPHKSRHQFDGDK